MTQTLLEMTKDLVLVQIHAHRLSPADMQAALHAQESSQDRGAVEAPEPPPHPSTGRKALRNMR
jgi:hypothetical protein